MKCLSILCVTFGCTTEPAVIRVTPDVIDLDVALGQLPPQVELQVLADGEEATARATFAWTGTPLGTLTGARLVSDGHTGGVALIAVSVDGAVAQVPVTATVHGHRLVAGAPADAASRFGGGEVDVALPLEPSDGAVLPPDLGELDVDFAADDADDLHELAVSAPHLDLHVYAPGAPGARHVELDADEWLAIANTTRGDGITLDVRSTHAGAPVHRQTSRLAIADLDVSNLVFSGAVVDAAGAPGTPQLYRYQPRTAVVDPFVGALGDDHGGCIGCHITISADGKRIAAGGTLSATGVLVGVVIDTSSHALVAASDTTLPWSTSAFDPSGALVTSYQGDGRLLLRDGNTAAQIAPVPIGETASSPAISPDGHQLAYVALPAAGDSFVGTALRVRPWDAATNTVGPVTTLDTAGGVMGPQFSPDGSWLFYARTPSTGQGVAQAMMAVRADGSAPPIELTVDAGDGIPRWASPITTARAGGHDPEPMAWIAFASTRPIGPTVLIGKQRALWLAAFYPERGVVSHPFHLPGQSLALSSLHAPVVLP